MNGWDARSTLDRATLQRSELDARDMLVDFADIKRKVKHWIDENLDHNMLLCRDDPLLPVLRKRGERVFEMDCNRTAENIAWLVLNMPGLKDTHCNASRIPVADEIDDHSPFSTS